MVHANDHHQFDAGLTLPARLAINGYACSHQHHLSQMPLELVLRRVLPPPLRYGRIPTIACKNSIKTWGGHVVVGRLWDGLSHMDHDGALFLYRCWVSGCAPCRILGPIFVCMSCIFPIFFLDGRTFRHDGNIYWPRNENKRMPSTTIK